MLFVGVPPERASALLGALPQGHVADLPRSIDEARAHLGEKAYDAVFLPEEALGGDPEALLEELRGACPAAVFTVLPASPAAALASVKECVRLLGEKRRLAEELGRTCQLLMRRERLAAVGWLLPGLCHEFNNPLSFVLSNVENLAEYAADVRLVLQAYRERLQAAGLHDEQLRMLEREVDFEFILGDSERAACDAASGARRLRDLVTALRSCAGYEVERGPMDLARAVMQATSIVGKSARSRASLEVDVAPGLTVVGSMSAVGQVLVALVTHALESFQERKPAENWVRVTAERRGDAVALLVASNGPEVPPEIQAKMLDLQAAVTSDGEIGLGPAVASGIAKDMGGEVIIEPAETGTRFALLLPLVK